jgi:rhodanese-related sulfurtransferase
MKKARKGFQQMVDEAKSRIKTISLEDAKSRLGSDRVVFVDLRDVRELEREGMIPGAFHCPRGMLEFWVDPDSPYHKDVFASDKEFVFYCNGARWTAASPSGRSAGTRSRRSRPRRARSAEPPASRPAPGQTPTLPSMPRNRWRGSPPPRRSPAPSGCS